MSRKVGLIACMRLDLACRPTPLFRENIWNQRCNCFSLQNTSNKRVSSKSTPDWKRLRRWFAPFSRPCRENDEGVGGLWTRSDVTGVLAAAEAGFLFSRRTASLKRCPDTERGLFALWEQGRFPFDSFAEAQSLRAGSQCSKWKICFPPFENRERWGRLALSEKQLPHPCSARVRNDIGVGCACEE
jgi:hypothetical protein